MNPVWASHRIGGPRRRRVWRLTPGTAIRSNLDRTSWGEIVGADTIRTPRDQILRGPADRTVQLGVKAVLDCGGGRLRVHYYKSAVDFKATAYTTVNTRILEGGRK